MNAARLAQKLSEAGERGSGFGGAEKARSQGYYRGVIDEEGEEKKRDEKMKKKKRHNDN